MSALTQTPSCYIFEYSVGPGGARKGDVFVHGDFHKLRESVEEHNGPGCVVDPYLIMWYGTTLHMFVFDQGTLVREFDLHPFLRTGNEVWDRTLARVIGHRESTEPEGLAEPAWKGIDRLLRAYDFDCQEALPLLTRAFELRDRAVAGDDAALAEYRQLVADADEHRRQPSESAGVEFTLDWDAIESAVPPLTGPPFTEGWAAVSLPPDLWTVFSERQSYLTVDRSVNVHVGWNDLEFGFDEEEFPDDEEFFDDEESPDDEESAKEGS